MFANMNEATQMNYVRKMMAERDRAGQLGYAHHQGREEEKKAIARAFKAEGVSVDIIAKCTGLTLEQISTL